MQRARLAVSRRARYLSGSAGSGAQDDTASKGTRMSSEDGQPLAHLGRIIPVASGKGGVGKSTVSVNLAIALAGRGHRVGIVDADLYGPSIPGMLGIDTAKPPAMTPEKKVIPATAHGVSVISMAMLTGDDKPAVLRGPMVTKYLQMFLTAVEWGTLDYLILDLPPGTGDTQLTLAQSFPMSGAVVVTTPQNVSLKITRRGIRMFEEVKIPILGIVENMSSFACPSCGTVTEVFSKGGGRRLSEDLAIPYLGSIPLDPAVVDSGDSGAPLVTTHPDSATALAYGALADALDGTARGDQGLPVPFEWDWASGSGAPARGSGSGADTPVAMTQADARTLRIAWGDGQEQDIDVRDLRLACACAGCRDEDTGAPLLDPARVPLEVAPVTIWSVGNYGIGVAFSDGHGTGIYPFAKLRALAAAESEDV